jgi:hypothetical protein
MFAGLRVRGPAMLSVMAVDDQPLILRGLRAAFAETLDIRLGEVVRPSAAAPSLRAWSTGAQDAFAE